MSEKPIIFSGPMVRAILAGTKTQTRRLVKPQPIEVDDAGRWYRMPSGGRSLNCYGAYCEVGDTLWVREPWRAAARWNDRPPRDIPAREVTICYEAGGSSSNDGRGWAHRPDWPVGGMPDWIGKPRRSFHMPRWASRLTLRITSVRVERLQEITEDDAIAEGGRRFDICGHITWRHDGRDETLTYESPRDSFAVLWDTLNAKRAPWSSNPWVWVVEFERVS